MEDEEKAINQDEGKAGRRSPSAFDQGYGGGEAVPCKVIRITLPGK